MVSPFGLVESTMESDSPHEDLLFCDMVPRPISGSRQKFGADKGGRLCARDISSLASGLRDPVSLVRQVKTSPKTLSRVRFPPQLSRGEVSPQPAQRPRQAQLAPAAAPQVQLADRSAIMVVFLGVKVRNGEARIVMEHLIFFLVVAMNSELFGTWCAQGRVEFVPPTRVIDSRYLE